MEKFENLANIFQNDSIGHLIVRLMVGLMMLPHGIAKLGEGGLDGIMGMLAGVGLPGFIAYGVFIGEIVAAIMIILGFRARLGALLMAFNMVVAIALAHSTDVFKLTAYGVVSLETQYFYLFSALAIVFLGAGRYAVSRKSKWD
jgi:putative oxidoreductase